MKTVEKITKENISQIKFSSKEVLEAMEAKKFRMSNLLRASSLGNLLRNKVNIIFEDKNENIYEVNTTVWAVGDKFVLLKGGIHIPINAIHDVH